MVKELVDKEKLWTKINIEKMEDRKEFVYFAKVMCSMGFGGAPTFASDPCPDIYGIC